MPPKTEFTIPLGKTVNIVTTTSRSKWEVRTTEKITPHPSAQPTTSGQQSVSRRRTEAIDDADAPGHKPQSTEEVYMLPSMEAQDDGVHDFETEDSPSKSNVCFIIPSNTVILLMSL
jgi:hypothetical protein